MPSKPHPTSPSRPHSRRRRSLQLFVLLAPLCTLLTIGSLYAQGDAGAPTGTPSGAPTGAPPSPPSVYAPWVVAAAPDGAPYLEGQLTLGDFPLAGALVELRQCTDETPGGDVVLTATTNLSGNYRADLPATPAQAPPSSAHAYALTLLTAPVITSTSTITDVPFAIFKSHCLLTPTGVRRTFPALDLASPQVITPSQAISVDMPVIFTWQGRTRHAPNESYQWFGSVQYDCGGCAPVLIASQPLSDTATTVEWCSIAPHYSGVSDVVWVDYFLRVTNDRGTGDTAIRRVYVGVTTHECPPLPPEP